jgi:hypothetical protein
MHLIKFCSYFIKDSFLLEREGARAKKNRANNNYSIFTTDYVIFRVI